MDKILQLLLTELVAYVEAHPAALQGLIQAFFSLLEQEILKAVEKNATPTA